MFLGTITFSCQVDIYNAGHIHASEVTYPILKGSVTQKNYINPKGVVHITEGNGGVPGVSNSSTMVDCQKLSPWCRVTGTGGAYGRWQFFNTTHAEYQHVQK